MYTNIIPDSAIAGRPDQVVTVGSNQYTVANGVLRYDMAPFFQNAFVIGAQTLDGTPLPYPKGTYFWNFVLSPIASTKFQESADKAIAAGDIVAAIFYLYAAPMIEKDQSLPTGNVPNGAANVPCPNADQLQAWEYNSIVQNIQDQELNTDNVLGFTEPSPTSSVATLENWINNIGPNFGIQGETFTDDQVFGFIYWNSKAYLRSQDVSVLSAYGAQGSSNWWNKYGGMVIGVAIAAVTLGAATGIIGGAAATTATTTSTTAVTAADVGTSAAEDTSDVVDEWGTTLAADDTGTAADMSSAIAGGTSGAGGGGMTLAQAAQYATQAVQYATEAAGVVKAVSPVLAPIAKALGIGQQSTPAPAPAPVPTYGYGTASGSATPQSSNMLLYLFLGIGAIAVIASRRK